MKFYLFFLLIFPSFSYAACNMEKPSTRFTVGGQAERSFLVEKGTDCIFTPKNHSGGVFVKSQTTVSPKNGRVAFNEHRYLYVPNKDFAGSDKAVVRIYIDNASGRDGYVTLTLNYTVK